MSHAADEDGYLEQMVNAMFNTTLATPVMPQSMKHPYAHMYEGEILSDGSTDEEDESRDEVSSIPSSNKQDSVMEQDPELKR